MNSCIKTGLREMRAKIAKIMKKKHCLSTHSVKSLTVKSNAKVIYIFRVGDDCCLYELVWLVVW